MTEQILTVIRDTANGLAAQVTQPAGLIMGGLVVLLVIGSFAALSMSLCRIRAPKPAA